MSDEAVTGRQREAFISAWFEKRIEAIHSRVTAYDILRRNGVELVQTSDDRAEQISCPFHGADENPSARVYPDSGESRSHVWCFVCQKPWDAIGLWKMFNDPGGDKRFGQILREMEQAYGLETPPFPKELRQKAIEEDEAAKLLRQFQERLSVAEYRMRHHGRDAFKDNMEGFLLLGSALDKTRNQVEAKTLPVERGITIVEKVIAKIAEKERTGGP